MSRTITYAEALNEAIAEEMERDEQVFVMGEDVENMSMWGVLAGIPEKFPKRIFDTPLSETFIVGAGVGAAITGLRPIVELMFADFFQVAMDELYGKAAKWRYMHGGLMKVPMVVRLPEGAAGGAGPEHSMCPEAIFWSCPGAYVVTPSTPADAKGLMKSAIRNDNPVFFFEHKVLYSMEGEVPDGEHLVPLGKADIKREGSDVTVIAWSNLVLSALEAAEQLAGEGISVEVLDPRGINPLDKEAILASVEKTGRVVLAHEAAKTGGPGSEVAAIIAEEALTSLAAPIKRVGAPDIPIPQSVYLEQLYVPKTEDVVAAIREVME
jgi:pyruvate/2-oxoglutarate/acetoin dehydrogenase E1 component